jgi:hypothetical protein
LSLRLPKGTSALPIERDAWAFLEAAGITSALQQRAVVQLVRDLKKAQLWTKMKAVYPFVGGTATTHKWNLKDPQDTNGAFRLTFNGGWTHDSNGIDGNGSNAWADTYFVPDTQFSSGSASSVVTVAQDAAIAGADYASFNSGSTAGFGFLSRWSNNLANDPTIFDGVSDIYRSSTNRVTFDNANAIGTYVTSRTSTTVHKVYKNGSQVGSTNTGTEADKSLVTASIGVCVINRPNGNRTGYTSRQLRFLGFGSGLTDAEALLITNVVTHYQKTLGRSL